MTLAQRSRGVSRSQSWFYGRFAFLGALSMVRHTHPAHSAQVADLETVPESPRFLIQKNRHDEALDVLIRLHRDPADPSNTFARRELQLIETRWQTETTMIARDGRWRLFKKPNRQRLILATMVIVGGQNIGPLVINNYNVRLYGSLGLDATKSLLLSAVYNTVSFCFACVASVISDRLGRRKAMRKTAGTTLCTFVANFALSDGLYSEHGYFCHIDWAPWQVQ